MKTKVVYSLLLLLSISFFAMAQEQIKSMSFNIRLDVESDGVNRWDARKDKVAGLMNYYEPDFIGCQEVLQHQLEYLSSQLTHYNFIGVARDDGKQAGEYSCIFYNKEKFEVVKQSTFWLSPTPDTVSMGWDAACHRVCTFGLFKSKKSKQFIWVFNTHLDHMGVIAREESAKLIIKKIKELTAAKNYPVILSGDFNSKPGEAAADYISKYLKNSRTASEEKPYGPIDTWNAFQFTKTPQGCIDYIFISNDNRVAAKKIATITDSYDMKYPSDHFPILATIELK